MIIRYLTAIIGALLIFAGVFFICGIFITPHLPEIFQSYIPSENFGTNNIVGVVLGLIAGASSFFATIRMKK